MIWCRTAVFLCLHKAVLLWRDGHILLELTAEVFHIAIAAEFRNLGNGFIRIHELVLRQTNPAFDDIIHAGDTEAGFVQGLQVSGADVQIFSHQRNGPVPLGLVINLLAQIQYG